MKLDNQTKLSPGTRFRVDGSDNSYCQRAIERTGSNWFVVKKVGGWSKTFRGYKHFAYDCPEGFFCWSDMLEIKLNPPVVSCLPIDLPLD